ncbi:hypothetical protein BM221_009167 [Beauveria bassiana]|uniref:Uncharacterized protein n=1 Tax=Beauveria bassiana TaxID=176275 RepID=A0A2N6NCG2_BEABA|nr:hypothetical protein BM221_009167 [Beauveria bassiana]
MPKPKDTPPPPPPPPPANSEKKPCDCSRPFQARGDNFEGCPAPFMDTSPNGQVRVCIQSGCPTKDEWKAKCVN